MYSTLSLLTGLVDFEEKFVDVKAFKVKTFRERNNHQVPQPMQRWDPHSPRCLTAMYPDRASAA